MGIDEYHFQSLEEALYSGRDNDGANSEISFPSPSGSLDNPTGRSNEEDNTNAGSARNSGAVDLDNVTENSRETDAFASRFVSAGRTGSRRAARPVIAPRATGISRDSLGSASAGRSRDFNSTGNASRSASGSVPSTSPRRESQSVFMLPSGGSSRDIDYGSRSTEATLNERSNLVQQGNVRRNRDHTRLDMPVSIIQESEHTNVLFTLTGFNMFFILNIFSLPALCFLPPKRRRAFARGILIAFFSILIVSAVLLLIFPGLMKMGLYGYRGTRHGSSGTTSGSSSIPTDYDYSEFLSQYSQYMRKMLWK